MGRRVKSLLDDGGHLVFSVVIPTYNRASSIERAVRSTLEQTHTALEILVVDDGSTDETRTVLDSIRDPRLRTLRQSNRGRCAARNAGLAEARGDFVVFLDSDDLALPNWLSDFAEGFERSQSVGVVCTGHRRVLDGGEPRDFLPYPLDDFFEADGASGLFVAGTFAVRRQLLLDIGGYAENLTFSENTELALRLVPHCLASGHRLEAVRRAGSVYYMNRSEVPSRQDLRDALASSEFILQKHAPRLARSPRPYSYYLGTAGVRAARLGDYAKARAYFARAVRQHPARLRHSGRWILTALPWIRNRIWAPPDD